MSAWEPTTWEPTTLAPTGFHGRLEPDTRYLLGVPFGPAHPDRRVFLECTRRTQWIVIRRVTIRLGKLHELGEVLETLGEIESRMSDQDTQAWATNKLARIARDRALVYTSQVFALMMGRS